MLSGENGFGCFYDESHNLDCLSAEKAGKTSQF